MNKMIILYKKDNQRKIIKDNLTNLLILLMRTCII